MSEARTGPVDCLAPDLALSTDERRQANELVGAIDSTPTLTWEEIGERHAPPGVDDPSSVAGWHDLNYRPKAHDLPGFGDAYDGSKGRVPCGAEIPHYCQDCGHRVDVGRTCARSTCPRCGAAWVLKRAPKLVSRIQEAAKMKSAAMDDKTPVYKHHVIVSPPHDWYADVDDPTEELLQVGHRIMDAIDMDGIEVYHGWRGASDEGEPTDDRGEWKKRLFNDRTWDDVREEIEPSPHLHLIGACPWVPGGDVTAAVHEATDWIIHRVTERNGSAVSLGDMSSVARAVSYCLSHCALDTSGERTRSLYRRHGSAFTNADLRTLDEAREAVAHVGRETLGLPAASVECRSTVADDGDDLDHLDDVDDGDGDDDGADEQDADDNTRTCRGQLSMIDEADDDLDDEEWCRSVPDNNLEHLRETYEEWQAVGGWQGWIDEEQSTLPPPD